MMALFGQIPTAYMKNTRFDRDNWSTLRCRLLAFAGLITLSGCASHAFVPPEEMFHARGYYGTDRTPVQNAGSSLDYGSERGKIAYGTVDLDIWVREADDTDEEDNNDLLGPTGARIDFVTAQSQEDFFAALRDPTRAGEPQRVMLFVHGFKRDFHTAAENAAQVAVGIDFPGRSVIWSWPSQDSAKSYLSDLTNLQWSEKHLARFITDLVEIGGVTNLTLVAHSLGSQGLTQALFTEIGGNRLEQWNVIDNLVLLAPDIDAAIFERDLVPAIESAGIATTIYTSANDWALITSSNLNGYPRVGDASDGVLSFAGVDTIDATLVANSGLGHSYYRRSFDVLDDMRRLIVDQMPIEERPNLTKRENGKGTYWSLQ